MSGKTLKQNKNTATAAREPVLEYSRKIAALRMKDEGVSIISAYRPKAEDPEQRKAERLANVERAIEACRFTSLMGMIPMCPHIYAPQFLDDDDEQERTIGMNISKAWIRLCGQAWVWGYTGPESISKGMHSDIRTARYTGIRVLAFPEPSEFFRLMEEKTRGMTEKEGVRYIWSVINRSEYIVGAPHAPVYDIIKEDGNHE